MNDPQPEGHYDRLPMMAADLARRQVTAILATGGNPPVFAVKAATATTPIVYSRLLVDGRWTDYVQAERSLAIILMVEGFYQPSLTRPKSIDNGRGRPSSEPGATLWV